MTAVEFLHSKGLNKWKNLQVVSNDNKVLFLKELLDEYAEIKQNSINTVLCGEGDKEIKYVQLDDPETRTTTINVLPYPPNEPLLREGEATEGISSAPEGY